MRQRHEKSLQKEAVFPGFFLGAFLSSLKSHSGGWRSLARHSSLFSSARCVISTARQEFVPGPDEWLAAIGPQHRPGQILAGDGKITVSALRRKEVKGALGTDSTPSSQ
jgi:hypothetical protein